MSLGEWALELAVLGAAGEYKAEQFVLGLPTEMFGDDGKVSADSLTAYIAQREHLEP